MGKNKVAERIKEAVKNKGLTQQAFAKKYGFGESIVSKWLSGARNPSLSSLKKISKATDKPLSFFIEAQDKDLTIGDITPLTAENTVRLPIVATAPCGNADYCSFNETDFESFTEIPRYLFPGANFIVKCQGESMIPTIPENAYCVIKKTNELLFGKIVFVRTENGFTIKKLIKKNGRPALEWLNPKGKIVVPKELEVMGRIIGIWNKID